MPLLEDKLPMESPHLLSFGNAAHAPWTAKQITLSKKPAFFMKKAGFFVFMEAFTILAFARIETLARLEPT